MKKLLSLLLALTMIFSVVGTVSYADEAETEEIIIEEEFVEEEFLQLMAAGTPTLYVSSDYNSETEGWGVTHFSSYASAYSYATANAKNALMIIEDGTGHFDNNHKSYSKLAVTVKDGATMGNSLSKWDMTYAVTVEPGGKLKSSRPANAGYGNSHIKNTLTVGAENSDKKAEIDFLGSNYNQKDMSIAVLYNGKLVANNAVIKVADLGFTGSATINDSEVEVKGVVAFGKNNFYKQTMTNSTMTVKGHNFMNENTYYSTEGNKFNNLTMDNSTITIDDEADGTTAEKVTFGALTMKNGSALMVEEGTPVSITFIKALGNKKTTTTIENSTLVVGDITIASQAEMIVDNAQLAMRRATGVSANTIHIEEGGKLKLDLVGGLSANKITGEGTLEIDASEYTSGVQSTNLDLSGFTGKVEVTNTNGKDLAFDVDENGIGVVSPAVAKIGDTLYSDFAEALSALGANETLTLLEDVTISELFNTNPGDGDLDIDVPCTIDGNGKTIKFLAGTICDRNNVNAPFRIEKNANTTFKNLTVDMSEAYSVDIRGNELNDLRAIATKSSITVENCQFIGNPNKKSRAIIFGEGAGDALANMEITITNSTFKDWGNRAICDNDNGQDAKKVTVKDCNFNGSKVQLSASEEIVFTGNTLKDTSLSIISYTDIESVKVTATENTIEETVSGLTYEVHAIGEGVSVQENIGTYVAEYSGKRYFTLEGAIAKAKSEIAADPAASRDITLFNNIADVNDDTLYYVYDEQPGKLEIEFNFGGGVNGGNYEFVKYYCDYMQSITAPTDMKKEGYFFVGWDTNGDGIFDKAIDNVPDKVWEPKIYTAIWQSYDKYGFKVTFTPQGGTAIEGEERAMKVNPGDYFLVNATVSDRFGCAAWNDADIIFAYNGTLFDFVFGEGVEEVTDANVLASLNLATGEKALRFRIYGADRENASLAKKISFMAKTTDGGGSKEGTFRVLKATVDTGSAANWIDATETANDEPGTVSIFYTYDVTLGEGLRGEAIATTDKDYVGTIKDYDGNYKYEVTVECNGQTFQAEQNGKDFTVPAEKIYGDMKITLTLIGLKGIEADDIAIYEYVGSVALVLLNAEDTREYTYNNGIMYHTPWYDGDANDNKTCFAYLVDTKDFVRDNTLDDKSPDYYKLALNTEENRKIALAKIGVTKEGDSRTNTTLVFVKGDVNKANNGDKIDINDVQAVWNCYNGNDSEQINVNMPLYLRADISGDMQVNSTDVSEVYALVK